MVAFLVFVLGMIWLLITGLGYLLAWIFTAMFGIVWVIKVLLICLMFAFLFDIFTAYKGNENWF